MITKKSVERIKLKVNDVIILRYSPDKRLSVWKFLGYRNGSLRLRGWSSVMHVRINDRSSFYKIVKKINATQMFDILVNNIHTEISQTGGLLVFQGLLNKK